MKQMDTIGDAYIAASWLSKGPGELKYSIQKSVCSLLLTWQRSHEINVRLNLGEFQAIGKHVTICSGSRGS